MSKFDFDLLTIGGGSGGVRTSRWAAKLGAKVAICEENRYGGTCVIQGCIPKKLMLEGSKLPHYNQYFSECGWTINKSSLNWCVQKLARDKEITRLEGIYENLLSKTGVEVLKGHGKITAPHTVEVNGKKYTAKNILIAVGSSPIMFNIPGIEHAITSDDIFKITKQPQSILVMGSGYIGVEFASIFNSFGSKVILVFRKPLPLSGFDKNIRLFMQQEMLKNKIEVMPNNTIHKIVKKDNQKQVFLSNGEIKTVEQVLFATGRKPKIQNLGLEQLGIKINTKSEITVNSFFETSVKNIYALGDCTNTPYQLTPVAIKEGMLLAEHLFAKSKVKMNYHLIPTAVFSQPLVATVGLTEEQALNKGYELDIYSSQFRPLKYSVTSIDKKTFMKMIVDKKTKKVLGLHMAGENAPEIIQGMAVALKAGATKSDFDNTIGIHPTSAEEFVTMR